MTRTFTSRRSSSPSSSRLDAQKIPRRMRGRERQQVVAVAEADLDGARCVAAEQRAHIEHLHPERDAVLRP